MQLRTHLLHRIDNAQSPKSALCSLASYSYGKDKDSKNEWYQKPLKIRPYKTKQTLVILPEVMIMAGFQRSLHDLLFTCPDYQTR